MLKRIAVWLIPIAIIVAVVAGAWSIRVPVPAAEQQQCLDAAQKSGNKQPYCPRNETLGQRGLRDPITYYTLWLTLFTGALAAFGLSQSYLLNRQISLARDEFLAVHSPDIRVRSFQILDTTAQGGNVTVTFMFVNKGELPAKIVRIDTCLTIARNLVPPIIFTSRDITGCVLERGDREQFEVPGDADLAFWRGFEGEKKVKALTTPIYVTGVVAYDDPKGRRRETGFCRVCRDGFRFKAYKKSPYEYRD